MPTISEYAISDQLYFWNKVVQDEVNMAEISIGIGFSMSFVYTFF